MKKGKDRKKKKERKKEKEDKKEGKERRRRRMKMSQNEENLYEQKMQLKENSKVKNFNRKTSTIKVLNDEHTNIQIIK